MFYLVGEPDEELAKEKLEMATHIYNTTGWLHKAAKLSIQPGISTLEEFNRKFPGQLSDRDQMIGSFQKPNMYNKYYTRNEERLSKRCELQKIHSGNPTRSTMYQETLSAYKFIDTQVNRN